MPNQNEFFLYLLSISNCRCRKCGDDSSGFFRKLFIFKLVVIRFLNLNILGAFFGIGNGLGIDNGVTDLFVCTVCLVLTCFKRCLNFVLL